VHPDVGMTKPDSKGNRHDDNDERRR